MRKCLMESEPLSPGSQSQSDSVCSTFITKPKLPLKEVLSLTTNAPNSLSFIRASASARLMCGRNQNFDVSMTNFMDGWLELDCAWKPELGVLGPGVVGIQSISGPAS